MFRKFAFDYGGGDLLPASLDAVGHLLAEKSRTGIAVDVIACGGILDGASLRAYARLGVQAGPVEDARNPVRGAV